MRLNGISLHKTMRPRCARKATHVIEHSAVTEDELDVSQEVVYGDVARGMCPG